MDPLADAPAASPMPGPAEPVPAPGAAGRAATLSAQIERLIYDGAFAPGERLNEVALADRFGISRGPVREAIRLLVGTGLVTPVRNRGVYVREISLRDVLELYELRALLFGHAAERAAENADAASLATSAALLAEMDAACEAGDGTAYYTANLRFHDLVMALGGNHRVRDTYAGVVKELHLFRRRYFDAAGNMRRSNQEHRQLHEAIASGSAARARAVATRHVMEGRQRVLARLDAVAPGRRG
jgi:DNA-binding GntR family transcriptional regulator